MNILIEIAVSVSFFIAGYIILNNYIKNGCLRHMKFSNAICISKSRIVYSCVSLVTLGLLIVVFNTIYQTNSVIHNIKLLVLISCIFPIAAVDYRQQKVPNQFIIISLIIRGILLIPEWLISPSTILNTLKDSVIGAVVVGVFFLLILLVFKNSIGMGDIKLFAIMGLYQGFWGVINSVFFSLLVSFLISIVLLITKKKNRKDSISFGPSILIGTVIAIGLAGI